MTITDVARKAGVSKTTVSRYLNKSGYVGEKTRKRIEKVIEENRYIPMAAAQNLSKGKSNTVAVLIPEIANPYFAAAFEGISEVADENQFNVFFYNTSAKPEKEDTCSMCGNFCAVKNMNKIMDGEIVSIFDE